MDLNGPLFDGQAAIAANEMCEEIEREVSDEGVNVVRGRLGQVLKKPTGHYASRITTSPHDNGIKVTGESVIYHWWLEGVGSRNFPATRFRGYHTFQLSAAVLRARAGSLAERVMRPFISRMGG